MWGIYVLIGIIILLLLISYYFIKDNKTLYAIENIKKYLEDPNNNHQMNYHFSKYLFIDREKRFPKNSLDSLTNLLLRIEKDIQIIPIIILYPIETEQKIFSKKCDELATLLEESETYKNKPFFVFFYNPNNQQMSIKISIQATLKCLPISTYCQTLKKYAFKISRGTRAIEVFLYNNLIVVYIDILEIIIFSISIKDNSDKLFDEFYSW